MDGDIGSKRLVIEAGAATLTQHLRSPTLSMVLRDRVDGLFETEGSQCRSPGNHARADARGLCGESVRSGLCSLEPETRPLRLRPRRRRWRAPRLFLKQGPKSRKRFAHDAALFLDALDDLRWRTTIDF